jgi:Polyphosphate kinase 2 (PPK2)
LSTPASSWSRFGWRGQEEQESRFFARINDLFRQWKLSDMDLQSYERWYDYWRARDMMLEMTDTRHAPWYIARSDDKRRGRWIASGAFWPCCRPVTAPQKVELPERPNKGRFTTRSPCSFGTSSLRSTETRGRANHIGLVEQGRLGAAAQAMIYSSELSLTGGLDIPLWF